MPEHDTFDLDAAFAALEQDIVTRTTPRGAAAAVATARRRRTTIGAAAAAALLVAGVGATAVTGRGNHAAPPADALESPAPLTGPRLTAATDGWTPAWTARTQQARLKVQETFGGPCYPSIPGGSPSAITWLGNSHGDVALVSMSDYGSHGAQEATDWFRVEQQLDGCADATRVGTFDDSSGALGRTYRIDPTSSESAPQYIWIVSTGRAIGVLKIFDQRDPLPAAGDHPVAKALLSAVRSPESYVGQPGAFSPREPSAGKS